MLNRLNESPMAVQSLTVSLYSISLRPICLQLFSILHRAFVVLPAESGVSAHSKICFHSYGSDQSMSFIENQEESENLVSREHQFPSCRAKIVLVAPCPMRQMPLLNQS